METTFYKRKQRVITNKLSVQYCRPTGRVPIIATFYIFF